MVYVTCQSLTGDKKSLLLGGDLSLIILWLTWTALVTALSDFFSGAITLLAGLRGPLTHARSPLPAAVA